MMAAITTTYLVIAILVGSIFATKTGESDPFVQSFAGGLWPITVLIYIGQKLARWVP